MNSLLEAIKTRVKACKDYKYNNELDQDKIDDINFALDLYIDLLTLARENTPEKDDVKREILASIQKEKDSVIARVIAEREGEPDWIDEDDYAKLASAYDTIADLDDGVLQALWDVGIRFALDLRLKGGE